MNSALSLRRTLLMTLATVLGISILGYGIFEARKLVQGPRITILAPMDGAATSSPAVTISGIAENVSFLSINDRPILTDEAGNFSELVAPPQGPAVFLVAAKDRFGRSTSRLIHITIVTYCPLHSAKAYYIHYG